eukprot:6185762-Pleurochrysis_carterae.AAC.2
MRCQMYTTDIEANARKSCSWFRGLIGNDPTDYLQMARHKITAYFELSSGAVTKHRMTMEVEI